MKNIASVLFVFFISFWIIVPQGVCAASYSEISSAGICDSVSYSEISSVGTRDGAVYTDVYDARNFSDFHQEDLTLYASSAVLTDADSGRILYGKAAGTPMANASTTKILTCILAIEEGTPDAVVTVSDYACSMPQVSLGFSPGDSFYLRDLLYSLMLESHNDTAVAVAEHIAGSVEAFADMMNEKAEEIGCLDSHFVTPNGLDAEDENGEHHTTAYDLSLIMSYCIQNEEFLEITRTASAQISTVDGTKQFALSNHNSLLEMTDGAISGKTGFTGKAGYCYVGAYQSGAHVYTFALLACGWPNNRDYKWSDSTQLIQYADENYTDRVLLSDGVRAEIPCDGAAAVRDGRIVYPETLEAVSSDAVITGFVSDQDEISVQYDLPERIAAPAKAGTVIGTEKVYLNHVLYAERSIVLTESAEFCDYSWCLKWIVRVFRI